MEYVTKYKQVIESPLFKRTLLEEGRYLLRNLALDYLSYKESILGEEDNLKKPRIQFLYVHHVFLDELDNFESLIVKLLRHHEFIPYSLAVEKILSNNIDKPYLVISTDDGFKNNIQAAEILNRYDIKSCFFINPPSIGLKKEREVINFCHNNLKFPATEFLDWNDVDKLLESGHEIGSHSMNHINISSASKDVMEHEIAESLEVLNNKYGNIKHFCFPFGRFHFFNKEAMEIVFKTGYESCASAERGCHAETKMKIMKEELLIRRDHVVCSWNFHHIRHFLIKNAKFNKISINPYS